jgi:DNA-binding transcriptional ArsR family regulator
LTDRQQNQVEDIVRLILAEERAAFLEMLAHELRGRELTAGELRFVAERTWRTFLQHGWPIRGPEDAA